MAAVIAFPIVVLPERLKAAADTRSKLAGQPDLVLISADKVRFEVHKTYLACASVVFNNMLSDSTPQTKGDVMPEVHLAESSIIVHWLLPFAYPIRVENLTVTTETMEQLVSRYEAAHKYELIRALEYVQHRIIIMKPEEKENYAIQIYKMAIRGRTPLLQEMAEPIVVRQALETDLLKEHGKDLPFEDFFKLSTRVTKILQQRNANAIRVINLYTTADWSPTLGATDSGFAVCATCKGSKKLYIYNSYQTCSACAGRNLPTVRWSTDQI